MRSEGHRSSIEDSFLVNLVESELRTYVVHGDQTWFYLLLCLSRGCDYVCIYVREHISKTMCPNFTKFSPYIAYVPIARSYNSAVPKYTGPTVFVVLDVIRGY